MLTREMVRAGNKASLFMGLYHSIQGCKGRHSGSRPVGSKVTWEILIYKLREVHSKGPALADRLEMSEPIKGNGERETLATTPTCQLGFLTHLDTVPDSAVGPQLWGPPRVPRLVPDSEHRLPTARSNTGSTGLQALRASVHCCRC